MHTSTIILLALGVASQASTIPARATLDLGSCSDPTIAFGIKTAKKLLSKLTTSLISIMAPPSLSEPSRTLSALNWPAIARPELMQKLHAQKRLLRPVNLTLSCSQSPKLF
jgi:hypothetical protein